MMLAVVFLPSILVSLNTLLVIVLCCYAIRIRSIRGPSTLGLISTVLAFIISLEVLLFKAEKALAVSILPKEHWLLLTTVNRYTDLVSRLLFFVGALWLLTVLIRRDRRIGISPHQ